MTLGHSKRKTILRSSIVFVIILSILISSISISFAYSEGTLTYPDDLIDISPTRISSDSQFYGPSITRNNLARIEDETARVVTMIRVPYTFTDANGSLDVAILYTVTSYNELIIIPSGINGYTYGVYSRTQHDHISLNSYSYTSGGSILDFYCASTPVNLNGFSGDWYRCSDTTLVNALIQNNGTYYCNANVVVINGSNDYFLASENLNVTSYLPQPEYIFNAIYNEQISNIRCEVNFNPRVYDSFVTVWGYNEYGGILYIYGDDQYNVWFGDEQDTEPETYFFYLDLTPLYTSYIGTEFHISSISCMGWEDGHEEYLSVNWDLNAEQNPTEYDPPNEYYYYSTFYNETYSYAEQNGNVVSFGNVDICLYSDQTLDRVFWDKQKTLITPYKFSYVFLPALYIGDSYYNLLDELCLEFDVVICNCPDTVFDAIYGSGAAAEFRNLSTTNALILWYTTKFRFYDVIDYSYFDILPESNYTSYDCTVLYTDSFYFKSLSYLFGDNNDRLLEFEKRILGENGAFQELLKSLKSMYENDYGYYSGMLTYMSKLNYIVKQVTDSNYFNNVLKYLNTLSEKDFTIDLPEFDFSTVISKYPDSSISNLTDFISNSVSDLPSWDFSSLSTFTNSIRDLFLSVAPDGQFIENIDQPYSFGDTVEDSLFPE